MPEANARATSQDALSPSELAELELQQELRSMFNVDTQEYLQAYISLVQQLQHSTWTVDVQEMYRCIHTIKGGAVTVGADPVLYVSAALEDLLSDLRYLQTPPLLADGKLSQMLLEAGELLTGSLQIAAIGQSALEIVQPTVDRILALRAAVQQNYLPEWDEHQQLFQEFAENGFDLVVLDLTMALEQLPAEGTVPATTVRTAKQTLRQLLQIGKDLGFDAGWLQLLKRSQVLLHRLENAFWQLNWPRYLELLKDISRKGGKLPQPQQPVAPVAIEVAAAAPVAVAIAEVTPPLVTVEPEIQPEPSEIPEPAQLPEPEGLLAEDAFVSVPDPSEIEPTTAKAATSAASAQIPVPLERLDRSAQDLIETLLAARAVQGFYNTLQVQLQQMVTLAQDSANYITRLRQIQDDYALLDHLQVDPDSSGPTLERYRQGYTIINRLLETSLRLSELGAEVSTSNYQTAESIQRLDRNILDLQQTVEASRLVPFKTLSFRARGILRDLTNRYGKPTQLVVQGEQIELDAGTVQGLEPALLHLIRNAYDHGLESPKERLGLGKPEQGTINLSLRRQGKTYSLTVQDDGRGVDAKLIQQIAQNKGLPLKSTDTPAQLLAVLCQPGFSSRDAVSDLSGRGVGMDVVADQVNSLGGRLSLDTVVGQGTTFHLQIPVPRLLVRCVLVQSGDRTLAIPADEVITTNLLDNLSATRAEEDSSYSWIIKDEDQSLPGLTLQEYWSQGKAAIGRSLVETAVCLRVRAATGDAWLIADELLDQVDLLINPIPDPLVLPAGLMGVSLLTDGKLVPVLEPARLAEWLLTNPVSSQLAHPLTNEAAPIPPVAQSDVDRKPTILVVDDAALVRRRIEASLTNYGYTVQTCRDGLEAWNWLQDHPTPALMISDIEMPGMDGFTLINRCRQAEMTMPVLVVSSRLSEEWGDEARRLGATDYLTKGFTTPELIEKVSAYLT
jgi:chemotaxis protein histidine kinase CheA